MAESWSDTIAGALSARRRRRQEADERREREVRALEKIAAALEPREDDRRPS